MYTLAYSVRATSCVCADVQHVRGSLHNMRKVDIKIRHQTKAFACAHVHSVAPRAHAGPRSHQASA